MNMDPECHSCRNSITEQLWKCNFVDPPIWLCPNCMRSRLAAEHATRKAAQDLLRVCLLVPRGGGATGDIYMNCQVCKRSDGHAPNCELAAALEEPE